MMKACCATRYGDKALRAAMIMAIAGAPALMAAQTQGRLPTDGCAAPTARQALRPRPEPRDRTTIESDRPYYPAHP